MTDPVSHLFPRQDWASLAQQNHRRPACQEQKTKSSRLPMMSHNRQGAEIWLRSDGGWTSLSEGRRAKRLAVRRAKVERYVNWFVSVSSACTDNHHGFKNEKAQTCFMKCFLNAHKLLFEWLDVLKQIRHFTAEVQRSRCPAAAAVWVQPLWGSA